ncbi:hypothetical protein NA57DRAFT_65513 [Rhizodiscina lignyota]|uniref:Linalool dehydratase/isomerase domain-containing protein n=1 Tax=Rhizodiscina lignyota TaxID=1504668 RepID=A0A9P4ICP5_9PEZI|nr:hypothetical protein NA57DRAFT_65513 [Rhizodiscina lignyota]
MATTTTVTQQLSLDLSKYPKFSRQQAGHLRHFHNLASATDGNWPHMGAQEPGQEFLDAYRYQLATMAYAAGLAHYHHMPAMRSLFQPLMRNLILKMLRREVWGYWYLTSQSGIRVDPDLKELRKPWADPVVTENIMYSGHLLLMTSLYAWLFDSDEFEKPGSIVFNWDPIFWGFGPEAFKYDNRSLQRAILNEMERSGWAGVCCEPNLVFVVCNQFPLIAMRYNDVRDGTDTIGEILPKYRAATAERKMIQTDDSLYVNAWRMRQKNVMPAHGLDFTAWANAFMNTWNSDFVRSVYDKQSLGYITNIDGKTEVQHTMVGTKFRELVNKEGAAPDSPETLKHAKEFFFSNKGMIKFPYTQPTFGYVVKWLSELGKTAELNALLDYADARLKPTWENGGLFYPRNDQQVDEDANWTHMDPFTGNAAIGYGRFNVEDGQKKMWDHPWTREDVAKRPYVDGLDLSQDVDCLRGSWDEDMQGMIVTLKSWDAAVHKISFTVKNLPNGHKWAVYRNGALSTTTSASNIDIRDAVGEEELDIVILKV